MLDLFCGAGGAAMGYHRAGFDVVGIDIAPQPRYPFEFVQGDWSRYIEYIGVDRFDAIHASPPCQAYSAMSSCRPGLSDQYDALVDDVRGLLDDLDVPYVIENVEGAPLAEQPTLDGSHGVTLCGRMFGLRLYRHRLFESNVPLTQPPHPPHDVPASRAGYWERGTVVSVSGHVNNIAEARAAMGIDWTNRDELAEAVPPAYTQFIGEQILAAVAL